MAGLQDLIGYQVYMIIFGFLLPHSLYRMRRVDHLHKRLVDHYIKKTFDINQFLSHLFEPRGDQVHMARELRGKMATTGAIIGGATALKFLDRQMHPGARVQIYVNITSKPH